MESDISGFVSFMGKYHGIIGIFCSKELALKIASSMLMEEITKFTTDVIDTIGEISNMIAGNVKTKITEDYGEMELSVPIVMLGNGTKSEEIQSELISFYTKEPWLLTNFNLDDDIFKVGLLLKEFVG
jgi:chemotaxis protein CheX